MANQPEFPFTFNCFQLSACFATPQHHAFVLVFGNPSNDAPASNQTMTTRCLSSTDVTCNGAVGKGLQMALCQ